MMKYAQIKQVIEETKACPDGGAITACVSCIADAVARISANKCWYCHNARITRAVKLFFDTHDLVHLVCENCAQALDGDRCTFIALEGQV